jgi:hypothetical protein
MPCQSRVLVSVYIQLFMVLEVAAVQLRRLVIIVVVTQGGCYYGGVAEALAE